MSEDLYRAVDRYIADTFSRDDEALVTVEKSLRDAGIENISVSSSQGKLLQLLARLAGARSIL